MQLLFIHMTKLSKVIFCLLWFLDLEMAVAYWNLVLTGRFKFLDLWNKFLLVSFLSIDCAKYSRILQIFQAIHLFKKVIE